MTEPSEPRQIADRIIDALLERYVAVIPMAERERLAGEIEAVRRAETERCAKLAEDEERMTGISYAGKFHSSAIATAIRSGRTVPRTSPGEIVKAAEAVVFHYFNCNGECGKLPGSVGLLAKAIGYSDPAVNDEIAAAIRGNRND